MSVAALWSRENLAWAAGLFEGEGCISVKKQTAQLHLSMTDEDVVRKFHRVVGFGNVYGPKYDKRKPHFKPSWHWSGSGQALVQAILAAFWCFLGERRRQRAAEAIRACAAFQTWVGLRKKCPHGHEYTVENTYLWVSRDGLKKSRKCRLCCGLRPLRTEKELSGVV